VGSEVRSGERRVFNFASLFEIDTQSPVSKEAGYLNTDFRLAQVLEHLQPRNADVNMSALI
jgi:hypothetical protein